MEYQILQQKEFPFVKRIPFVEKLKSVFLEEGDWFGLSELF